MMPGMNAKQMKQMERQMKKMGMKMETLDGAREVIIRFDEKELVIPNPEVTFMNAMGQNTYQIMGEAVERGIEEELIIPDEDVEMVASTANVSMEDARQALEDANGDIADAILKLQE